MASILAAFAIDAWWDTRKESAETRAVLADLQAEVADNLALLDRVLWIRESRSSAAEALLEGSSALPTDSLLNSALTEVMLGSTSVNLATGAYSVFLASGSTENIESRELRGLLASWPGLLDESAEDEVDERALAHDVLTPFLGARVDLAPIYSDFMGANEVFGTFPDSEFGFKTAPRSLLTDPEFRNLVVVRLGRNRVLIREATALREAAERMHELISEELSR